MGFSWRSALRAVCIISAAAAGAVILYRFDPSTHAYPVCVFHALTGLQCPGCGTTRAVHHLLHGDVAGAFHLNAMLFVGVPFGAVAAFSRRVAMHPLSGWAALTATVGWWIARNLLHA